MSSKMMPAAYATFIENWYLTHPTEIESEYQLYMNWEEGDNNAWTLTITPTLTVTAEDVAAKLNALSDAFSPEVIDETHLLMSYPLEYADDTPADEIASMLYGQFTEFGWIATDDTVEYVKTENDAYVYLISATNSSTAETLCLSDYFNAENNPGVTLSTMDLTEEMIPYADGLFADCTGITSIADGSFNSITSAKGMFKGCTALTSVPSDSFKYVTDATEMFDGCTALATVPADAFPRVATATRMFNGCTALTSITPKYNTVTNATSMFQGCTGITALPDKRSLIS